MCRQHKLWGCSVMTFGLGLLIGIWLEGGFWCHCLGIALVICGFMSLRKK